MALENKTIDQSSASTSDNLRRSIIATQEDNMLDFEERIKLLEAQKNLLPPLRLDTIKLCDILQLSGAAKSSVRMLLEYVINNHLINTELTMLQAFQLSLCWTAASSLKEKVNHKQSVACAKKHLNFSCKKDEVDYVYAMLQCLKSTLLSCTAQFKATESPKLAESSCRDHLKDHSNAKVSHSATCKFQKVTSDNGGLSVDQEYIAQNDVSKSIKQIQKKFQKKMKKYTDKHLKWRKEILRSYIEEKENLESKHKIESDVIRTCSWRYRMMRTGKPKLWEIEQEKEVEDHKHQLELHLERLKELQLEAASNLQKKENIWIDALKIWFYDELLYRRSLGALESADSMTGGVTGLSKTAEQVTDKAVTCSGYITRTPAWPIVNSALDTLTSETGLFTDVMGQNNTFKSCHDQDNLVSENSGAKDLINIGRTSDNTEGLPDVTENVCSTAALTKAISSGLPSSDEFLYNINPLPISDAEVEVAETVNSVDGPQRPHLLNLISPGQNPNGAAISVPHREAPVGLHGTISTSHDLCKLLSEIPTSCEEQVHVISPVTMQDKEMETGESIIFDDLENLVALDLPSSEEQILKSATEKENNEVRETISSSQDLHNVAPIISPSYEEQNPVMSVATVQDKEAEVGVLDKESNDYASLGEDQGNLVSVHSSSSEEQLAESAPGKENGEAQALASDTATHVNQQHLVDSAVNGNSFQEMPMEGSPSIQPLIALVLGESLTAHQADKDQGTDMLATSSAAQVGDARACVNQNTCQPMEGLFFDGIEFQLRSEEFDFNQVSQVQNDSNQADFEPLQNELERLEREREESIKSHEDEKLQLTCDMEKRIKELKAEICQEYETKLQQREAELFQKHEDLRANRTRVLNHMVLARALYLAFKTNGMDVSGSSSSAVHHDGNFTVHRQQVQSCMQQNAQMLSLVSSSSSANPHVAFRQTTPLALVTSPHYAAPPIQSFDHFPNTPVLSSTNPASNPHIGSFSSLAERQQGRVEIHARPQHLQPCRPSTSITRGTSSSSHEDGSSDQQSQRNSRLSSLLELFLAQSPVPIQMSVPDNMQHAHEIAGEPSMSITGNSSVNQQCGVISNQHPQRSSPPSPPSLPPQTQGPLVPTQQFVPDSVVHHPESAGGLAALRSASALELLIDLSYQCTGSRRSTQNSSRLEQYGGSTDVVCLSDDE